MESLFSFELEYFPPSKYQKLGLYVAPIYSDITKYVKLAETHDEKAISQTASAWFHDDAEQHLTEFSDAYRAIGSLRENIPLHNKNVKTFVDWESQIKEKINALFLREVTDRLYPSEAEEFSIIALLAFFDLKFTSTPDLNIIEETNISGSIHTLHYITFPTSNPVCKTKDASKIAQLLILISDWWSKYSQTRKELEAEIHSIEKYVQDFKNEVEKLRYKIQYDLPLKMICGYEKTLCERESKH